MNLAFTKMSGSGNDFILIDNREPLLPDDAKPQLVKNICSVKSSVGADGVIFIENSDNADYKWDFYNNDGSSAEMCGNGGRCVARYAYEKGIAPKEHTFETLAGLIEANVEGQNVKVRLTTPIDLKENLEVSFEGVDYNVDSLNTGVPHAIVFMEDVGSLKEESVEQIGRGIRHHAVFSPKGTNVNLVEKTNGNRLTVRTYERGVEGETLACGTGCVASAVMAHRRFQIETPVEVLTRGGETLKVHILPKENDKTEVYLEGLTKITFEGRIIEL